MRPDGVHHRWWERRTRLRRGSTGRRGNLRNGSTRWWLTAGAGGAYDDEDHRGGGEHKAQAHENERQRQHDVGPGTDRHRCGHPGRAVGVHHHCRPPATGRLPDQLLLSDPRGARHPEQLIDRRGDVVNTGRPSVRRNHAVEPDDTVMGDTIEIGVEVGLPGDPDEDRTIRVEGCRSEPDVEVDRIEHEVGRARFGGEPHVLTRDSHGR